MSVLAPGPVRALAPVPPSGGSAGASEPADFGALVVTSLLALTLLAVLAAIVAPRPVAALLILTAAVALPGAAITLRLNWGDTLTAIAITVALGLAIDIFAALAMVWSGWWHPMAAAAIVGAVSALTLVCAVRRPWRFATVKVDDWLRTVIALVPAVASLTLWLLSVRKDVGLVHLRSIGLPAGLPATWYLALTISLAGSVLSICNRRPRGLVIGVYVASLTIVLFGTLPALTHVPPYAWTYKHIGVTNLIAQTGAVHPGVDIYNRWPGFFAAAAAFGRLTDLGPISFAGWFEPLFAALDALLVAALARAIIGRVRVAAWAALLFTVCNFVGQDYYSPQAMAYVLGLALLVLVLRQLTDLRGLRGWLVAAIARVSPAGRPEPAVARPTIAPATSLGLILLLQVAIVATHQLTPYVLVAQVGALAVIGATRPRWLVAALAAIAIAYLLPNLGFVNSHFGLFTGFDPLGNAKVTTAGSTLPWAVVNGGDTISKLLSVMAVVAAVGLVRAGHGRKVAVVVTLAAMPYVILFAQSYGGEASLRVFLFSSPWRVILVAWGLASLRGTWRPLLAGFAAVSAMTVLWLPTFLGRAPLVVMPPGEVAASQFFYSHAPGGSVLTFLAPDFPSRVGPRYAAMADPEEDVSLTLDPALRGHQLGASDIPKVIAVMHLYSRSDFLVFAPTVTRYAVANRLLPAGSAESLQRAVASSSQFSLWYAAADVHIYRLLGQ